MFEKRVIKLAANEVTEKTEFIVRYNVIASGRRKDKIELKFKIRNSNCGDKIENNTTKEQRINIDKPKQEIETKLNIDKDLYDKLIHHGLKQNQISEFFNNPDIGLKGIEEGFNYYKRQLDSGKIHSNKSAYLFKSIKEKYGERTEDQKKEDEKESFKVKLNKKVDMFENYRIHGLSKKDMHKLKDEIIGMYETIKNYGAASTWRDKDVEFIMR